MKRLELVHFQITRRCNLHCWFCGQWGERGAFHTVDGKPMTLRDWQHVLDELERRREATGECPQIRLWGGEPTLSENFEPLCEEINRRGFPLGMVTNGTLLGKHIELCRSLFSEIYVSLDGTPEIHNAIRGAGAFEAAAENLLRLRGGKARRTLMTVMTPQTRLHLKETLDAFAALQPDEVLLQEQIALTRQEAQTYKRWLRRVFSAEAPGIDAWVTQEPVEHLPQAWYDEFLFQHPYPFPVRHLPHLGQGAPACRAPQHSLHITWNGETSFCTDFIDLSLGNVREQSLDEILGGERAEKFSLGVAAGKCPTCAHCAWRNG